MEKGLTIAITFESFYDGGAEMFAIRLANALSQNNRVLLIETQPYYTLGKEQIKFLSSDVLLFQLGKNLFGRILYKFKHITQHVPGLFRLYEYFKAIRVKRLLKKQKVDIINSHTWQTDVLFSKLSTPAKLIFSLHGHYELLETEYYYFSRLTVPALQRADRIVYLTDQHLKTLNKYKAPPEKLAKIFYGLDYPPLKKTTSYNGNEVLELVLVARGIKEKGWEETIMAFLDLDIKYPNKLRLHLVGSGDCLISLSQRFSNPNLLFHGYQNDVRQYILAAHIALLPTYYIAESLPNSVIEYLFCGKPVITTDIGAIAEMITYQNNVAGNLLQIKNDRVDTKDIETAIEKYILDPSLVNIHSELAIGASKKFTMEECAEAYSCLYHQALQFN